MNATDSTESPTKITASILIPVYQDTTGLETTLNALARVGIPRPDAEVIVCNDAGGEAISRLATRYGVREVRLDENRGSYAARNRGIDAAQGNILVFLDADQRVDEHWLDAGVRALEHADYAGGRIIVESGANPTVWERYDVLKAFPVEHYIEHLHFAPTANLFMRRAVFERIGVFHETLRSGGDFELGQRVYAAGFVQVYAPEAVTFHPARNRAEQFKKIQRVATGQADVDCLILKKNPLFLLLIQLLVLAKIPFETVWRLIRCLTMLGGKTPESQTVFIIIEKTKKFYSHWYIAKRSMHYVMNSVVLKRCA